LQVDTELEKEYAIDEITAFKKQNPSNKPPLFKVLGEVLGNSKDKDDMGLGDRTAADAIGCTANVILIDNHRKLYVANAGDSRCVLARGGKAIPLSFDHKPENEEERKRIEHAGSTILEGRVDGNLNLSRSLGDLKYKQKKSLKPEE
jgi:serine/threonine protein phosphatase PrpC